MISLLYKKDLVKKDGQNPLLIYGYGAYGAADNVEFDGSVLPLINRGFIYGVAHVRGGGEFGGQWHKAGSLINKRNSFYDLIEVTEYLVD